MGGQKRTSNLTFSTLNTYSPAAFRIFEGIAMTFLRNVASPKSFDLDAVVVVDGMVDVEVETIGASVSSPVPKEDGFVVKNPGW